MPDNEENSTDRFSVANEFTGVWVRKVKTAQGERLELFLPRTGTSALLDAMQLEAIVGMSKPQFSEFFARLLENQGTPH
jgi:hypothetical protein